MNVQQHPALAGFSIAVAVVHAVVGVHAAALARRGDERASFAVLNLVLAVFAAAYAVAAARPHDLALTVEVAEASRILATGLLVVDALGATGTVVPKRALQGWYAATALLFAASLAGLVVRWDAVAVREVVVLDVSLPDVVLSPEPLAIPAAVFALAGALAAPVLFARQVMRGKAEGIALAGATVLAVAAANDALHALGSVPGPPLAPLGFAAFVTSLVLSAAGRSARARRELDSRAAKLERRSRDLAREGAELRVEKEELVRKEQLAAVGELSAVIAHEVRNPLAIISNAVATLRRDQLDAADRETLLGILDEETSRLNRLVGDLLRYARPVDLQRQLVNVREILGRALGVAAQRGDVTVEVVESGEAPRTWGDASLLRQAIENLLTNAIQAMAGAGSLTINLSPREVDGAPGLELEIQDTGEGMDTSVRNRALDPFFTTRPAGTGLGLAIVARIIDAHGGKLTIDSKAGAGTRVKVTLPVGSEEPLESLVKERVSDVPLPAELKRAMGRR